MPPQSTGSVSALLLRLSLPAAGLDSSMLFHVRPGRSLRHIKRSFSSAMDMLALDMLTSELGAELVADSRKPSSEEEFSKFFADAERQLLEYGHKRQDVSHTGLRMPYLESEMQHVCKNPQGELETFSSSEEDEQLMPEEDGTDQTSKDHKSRWQTIDFSQPSIRAMLEQLPHSSSDCDSSASNDTSEVRDTTSSEHLSSLWHKQEAVNKMSRGVKCAETSDDQGRPARSLAPGVIIPLPGPRSPPKQRRCMTQCTTSSPKANSRQDVSTPRQDSFRSEHQDQVPSRLAGANPRCRFLTPLEDSAFRTATPAIGRRRRDAPLKASSFQTAPPAIGRGRRDAPLKASTFQTAPPAIGRGRDGLTFRPKDRSLSSSAKNYEILDESDGEVLLPCYPKPLPCIKPPSRSSSPTV
eukprot:TRINITY_DN15347_c0_g2_i1.p1 TRINITY_DN15347_c0_g2~~TRINITY_DN15347_c0_g2_i1.p1  ORF type:complete len:411 (-),score=55.74 TRINITY_DN15347_c0_g2_i1:60-1292(-)